MKNWFKQLMCKHRYVKTFWYPEYVNHLRLYYPKLNESGVIDRIFSQKECLI